MKLTSPAFSEGDLIPQQFTMDGADKSPPLQIEGVPLEAKSLVLVVNDPDAPGGDFTHWTLFKLPPNTETIPENAPPAVAVPGRNDFGDIGYGGPQPPSGQHRYFFRLYALDCGVSLSRGATREEVEDAIRGHVIRECELMGRYASSHFAATK